MARSILDRLIGKDKNNEIKYKPYDLKTKYGAKEPTADELLTEFDEKLSQVLDKMRQEGTSEQKELIALYEERANEFSKVVSHRSFSMDNHFFSQEMRVRSIQMFDDFLDGNDALKNNEQCLLLARDIDREVDCAVAGAAFMGFLTVALIVTAVVLAVVVEPIFLAFLLIALETGLFSGIDLLKSQEIIEKEEALTSFTKSGKSFFSDAEDGDLEQEKEAQKAP